MSAFAIGAGGRFSVMATGEGERSEILRKRFGRMQRDMAAIAKWEITVRIPSRIVESSLGTLANIERCAA